MTQLATDWYKFALRAQSENAKGKRQPKKISITLVVSEDNEVLGYHVQSVAIEPARNNRLVDICRNGHGDIVAELLHG